ncbi:glycosyltransferase family 2 protein [Candidatus Enterococcus ferrettii]|uniref:Nucleotidyl transferase domain-containing protein n=1 Tax=Candidatus Enterococcus ferrettii TaxID=2815324 RepID=A0ABV0ETS3_9ENTE|nr:glycosyltransferase family 2 protein [Enterococcus sp. 665A]MBO1342259.1 glycosyltransferase family 2 protein [Enterococcus sp. 665A]
MKVIITMAGRGSRFTKQGYTQPKHEIMAGDRSLFSWAIGSLKQFFDETFLFIVRKGSYSPTYLIEEIVGLGIKTYDIIELDEVTNGQADTVMQAAEFINKDEDLLIYNIDTTIQPEYLSKEAIRQADGSVPLFKAEGTHWSFAKLDRPQERITEMAEKRPISSWGSVGLYYFRQWQDFSEAFEVMSDQLLAEYGEIYIAPLYNYLIERGKTIHPVFLPEDSYAALGTPEELETFIKNNAHFVEEF